MAATRPDRRVQRTREALQRALVELILERGYEVITVQEIIDRANVGRSTFYAHYLDKQQLLLGSIAGLQVLLAEQQERAKAAHGGLAQGRFAFSLGMFAHAASHQQLYRAMVGKQSGAIVLREIQQVLADLTRSEIREAVLRKEDRAIPLDVEVEFVVSAFVGLLIWWLEARIPYSVQEIDDMFQRLTLSGLHGTLELPRDPQGRNS